jgi:protein-glutamine gamma-glutamyltransferase
MESAMIKQQLDLNKIMWLSLGIALAGFPHWQRLPLWIPISHIILLTTRVYIPFKFPDLWSQQKATINVIRLVIMFAGVAGVYSSFGSLAGRDVGVALLVLLAGFKVFESNSKRDFYISTYLGYFLIITNFFYIQTIPTAAYMVFVIIIMTAGLIEFNDTEKHLSLLKRFKLSTTLLIQAIPILLVLFILFPRVNGPLWGMPKDAFTNITGIDDQMSPGTINKLAQSSEVAFRVTFEDKIPKQSKLYWRGPVLWQTDGRKWTKGKDKFAQEPAAIEFTGEPINYDITIEPSNKKWLFGLEMVSELPRRTFFTNDYQLKTHDPIRTRKAYSLSSYTSFRINNEFGPELERGLTLPENSHLKTRELASKLRDEFIVPSLIVEGALEWFKKQAFVYTLSPPLISGDMVDGFLFNTRQGFCEYYAAAFTVLMRAAGIPARVVTGYQGGEVNPIGNYLIVRQYDAHAWTEVWLENQGWVRVDPTSIVAPIRVNEGINNAIPEAIIDIPLGLETNMTALRLWQRMRNTVDMINYQWAQWVLGYGPDRQKRFLQYLGFNSINWKKLTFYLFAFLGIIVAAISAYIIKKAPKTTEPAKKYYNIFCAKLAKIGIQRRSYEGPVDFARRITTTRQDLNADIQNITNLYVLIRYCSDTNNKKLFQLKAAIKSFSPSKIISNST